MIETKRLEIKPWTTADVDLFFELTQDEGFNLYPITRYRQPNHESAREWVHASNMLFEKTGLGKWAVWEKGNNLLIGMGGLTPWNFEGESLVDITYRLRESAWGMGYGLELAMALSQYGFDKVGLPQITATITPGNIPSKKIAAKMGMTFDRRIILLGVETNLHRALRKDWIALGRLG